MPPRWLMWVLGRSGQMKIGGLGIPGVGVAVADGTALGMPAPGQRLQRLGRLQPLLRVLRLQLQGLKELMTDQIPGRVETPGLRAVVAGLSRHLVGREIDLGGALQREISLILLVGPIGPTIAPGVEL